MEELIDVLDEHGNKTGEVLPKSEVKKRGLYPRAIAVCVVNSQNEILMQKRSPLKKVYPNLWSIFVKGHVDSKESSIDACRREVKEELGIIANEEEFQFLYTIYEEKKTADDFMERIFFDTYLLRKDVDMCKIAIQKEELCEVKLMPIEAIKDLLKNHYELVVPNQNDYERIFSLL